MDSTQALQFAVTSIQQNDYVTLAILTAIGYDYVLTFSNEIEYIWKKPWSRVSTLFVLVRYLGLLSFIIPVLRMFMARDALLIGLTKLVQSGKYIPTGSGKGEALYIVHQWAFSIFLGAADWVMILRVWSINNRSRLVIRTLIALYVMEIIPTFAISILYSPLKNLFASTTQVLELSFCTVEGSFRIPILSSVTTALQLTLGVVMWMLVGVQFMKQSLQMYKATRRWQISCYMNLFVREGIIYFLMFLVFNVMNLLGGSMIPLTAGGQATVAILEYLPICMFTPRFILSVRALYAHDLQGGHGVGIDTGFGLSTLSDASADGATLVFMHSGQDREIEQDEEIPMDEWRIQDIGSGV